MVGAKRVLSRRCKHCGDLESEHGHAFEATLIPECCVCSPLDWRDGDVRDVCAAFRGDEDERCTRCEHDEACHPETSGRDGGGNG